MIGEDSAAAPHDAIERARDAHAQAAHAMRERLLSRRFGEQVNVVPLLQRQLLGPRHLELGPDSWRSVAPRIPA
jgi:hypothetical protein